MAHPRRQLRLLGDQGFQRLRHGVGRVSDLFLARLAVGRTAALFAAAGAAAIPSLAYSSYVVEEFLAYPYAALCLFLITKAFVVRGRSRRSLAWGGGAVVASAVAPAVKGELVVIPLALLLALLFALWSSDRARARRTRWSPGDWAGLVVLVMGIVFALSGFASQHSMQWLRVTRYYKNRALEQGNWAVAALAIGIGIVPMIAGLAALAPARGEPPNRGVRMFRAVALGAVVSFGLYTAMKAAYLSTSFATRVEERNLIYVAPVLFVGTALVLERRRANLAALAGAALYVLYLVVYSGYHAVGSAYELGVQLYSDALGFSILQAANRYLLLSTTGARVVVAAIWAVGLAALLLLRFTARRQRAGIVLTVALGLAVVGWNVTGEIAAAAGSISISRSAGDTLKQPFSWVDEATGGQPTLYLGEGEADQNPEWMLEFWNRSLVRVSSLDGSVQGPGPAGGPDLGADGELSGAAACHICLRGGGPSMRRPRRHTSRVARLPSRRSPANVAADPTRPAESAALGLHRHLPGRLERSGRQRVLPLLERQRLAPDRRLAGRLGRSSRSEPGTPHSREARDQRQPPADPRLNHEAGRPLDRQPRDADALPADSAAAVRRACRGRQEVRTPRRRSAPLRHADAGGTDHLHVLPDQTRRLPVAPRRAGRNRAPDLSDVGGPGVRPRPSCS